MQSRQAGRHGRAGRHAVIEEQAGTAGRAGRQELNQVREAGKQAGRAEQRG
jgi:hypothetical protein